MSESESKSRLDVIVYFVVSPLEGPGYRVYESDDLQAMGGVPALERLLGSQSYWFAHLGQIVGEHNQHWIDGFTFKTSDLAQLPEPTEDAWQTGRLNPAFGKSEFEKRAFREVFQATQRMLDAWKTYVGTEVEAYALKELKISPQRLASWTTGLCTLKRVHDVLEVTALKFWYDSLWQSKPVPSEDLVLDEHSFKIPVQLRWAADQRLLSVDILSAVLC